MTRQEVDQYVRQMLESEFDCDVSILNEETNIFESAHHRQHAKQTGQGLDIEIVQISLKAVLGGEASVHQETLFVVPFFETAVVEQL